MSLNYLSACSGIEAASVAWEPLGWTPVGFSEIEPLPCSVLAHRFPLVPNYGDLTKHEQWPIERGAIDLLVGGTPCQSFSIAGKRAGLSDPRGQLMHSYVELAKRLRPEWIVWENVPGVLSSGGGRDFGSLLRALDELGYGLAWRVLDAQFVRVDGFPKAVPQRRRRVFVVGHLGSQRSASVLFEPEGGLWDSSEMLEARSEDAGESAECPRGSGEVTCFHPTQDPISSDGVAHALSGNATATAAVWPASVACTLDAASAAKHWATKQHLRGGGSLFIGPTMAVAGTLSALHARGDTDPDQCTLIPCDGVRRVTPRECERLQGFPDDWTLVPHRGKPAADGPRYKAIGNSMAVNVMRWIGRRIESNLS